MGDNVSCAGLGLETFFGGDCISWDGGFGDKLLLVPRPEPPPIIELRLLPELFTQT